MMIYDDGGFMRRETAWDRLPVDEPRCINCGACEDDCECERFESEDTQEIDFEGGRDD